MNSSSATSFSTGCGDASGTFTECAAGIYQSISSVNWNIDASAGGTCPDCSTNIGHTIGTQCSASAFSSSSGAIMDGENPNMNYLYTFDGGGANYNGNVNGQFTANWNSPPSSLIVMVYASSGGGEGTITSTVELTNVDTSVNYSCTEYANQESTTPFLSSTHYNDVYIIVCPNIPTVNGDSYSGPSIYLDSSTSGVVGTYAFNPNA